ncbi:hypothetical protein D3C84_466580 [compost metagenome]
MTWMTLLNWLRLSQCMACEPGDRISKLPLLSKLLMKSGSPACGLGKLRLLEDSVTISRV